MKHLYTLLLALIICVMCASTHAQMTRECKACGQSFSGSYFETGGAYYHPHHFVCDYCHDPIKGSYSVYRDKSYHDSCFKENIALRCQVCDGIIQGKHIIDHWGNAYHTRHQGEVSECDFCDRFIVGSLGDKMLRFKDGRRLCSICAPSSVRSKDEAESIMAEVSAQMKNFGLEVDHTQVELYLLDRQRMEKIATAHNATGYTDYVVKKNLFGKVKSQRIRVLLLYGMPRMEMIRTAAHELMHVWQFQNGYLKQDKVVSEGSCNYASYLVLRKIGGAESEFIIDSMLRDRDPIYGKGFRRVKRYAEKEGLASWIQQLQTKSPKLSAVVE